MEVLRDTVLDICRELFSNHSRPTVRVKCHIEVYADVSQIFCTSFEDVLCTDLSSEEFEETVDLRRVADQGEDLSRERRSFSPYANSDEKCPSLCRSETISRWFDSNSNDRGKCFERKILDPEWATRKVSLGDSNAQDLKLNLRYRSTVSCPSISSYAPQLLKHLTSRMDDRICEKRGSANDSMSMRHTSGRTDEEEVMRSQTERDTISKVSPLDLPRKLPKAFDCRKSGGELSEINSASSGKLEIVAMDDYFPSEAGSSVDQGEVDIYAAESNENESIRDTRELPLHCSEGLKTLQLNGSRSVASPSSGDAWHLNSAEDETLSPPDDRAKKFACSQCNCSFSMLTNLRRHVKKIHPDNAKHPVKLNHTPFGKSRQMPGLSETKVVKVVPKSDLTKTASSARYRHVCSFCDAVFTFRTNLTRHTKKTHGHVPISD